MSSKKRHVPFTNVQIPIKYPLHPPNIYMLELSPMSTKCTHSVAVKLFCRCCYSGGCEVVLYSPLHSRPWIGRIQDELRVNSDKNSIELSKS
jgi:hypothetical protein